MEPFRIAVAQADLDLLDAKLAGARWPAAAAPERGITVDRLAELADHWRTGFDWRAAEANLNRYPQFRTEVDGQIVHFLHVRCERPDALALLLTHGYPSSPAEFLGVVDLLRNDYHLVAPSLPGYGFSTPLSTPGTMGHTARAWAELMHRLGYQRYGVHGGDIGAGVSGAVAALDAAHVVGVHVVTDPMTAAATATFLPGMADGLNPDDDVDAVILERMAAFRGKSSGYLAIQNSRPQTIGYALADSPLFQLAWIAEKFDEWTQAPIDRDLLLTIVSLYWFTGSGVTAAHALYDQAHSSEWGGPVSVPQGFAVFGADETVRRLVQAPAGSHWTEFAHARHFPAIEAPTDLAADLRNFFA